MKILLDIADNKAADFIDLLHHHNYVKQKTISDADAILFNEIKEIKKAFKSAAQIKIGKLKGRPAEDFLNEL